MTFKKKYINLSSTKKKINIKINVIIGLKNNYFLTSITYSLSSSYKHVTFRPI